MESILAAALLALVPSPVVTGLSATGLPQTATVPQEATAKRALTFEEVAGKPGVTQVRISASPVSWAWGLHHPNLLRNVMLDGEGESKLYDPVTGNEVSESDSSGRSKGADLNAAGKLALTVEDEIKTAYGSQYTRKEIKKIAKALTDEGGAELHRFQVAPRLRRQRALGSAKRPRTRRGRARRGR